MQVTWCVRMLCIRPRPIISSQTVIAVTIVPALRVVIQKMTAPLPALSSKRNLKRQPE